MENKIRSQQFPYYTGFTVLLKFLIQFLEYCQFNQIIRLHNIITFNLICILQKKIVHSTTHVLRHILKWFADKNIVVKKHPSCSPDLSPMENILPEL